MEEIITQAEYNQLHHWYLVLDDVAKKYGTDITISSAMNKISIKIRNK